MHKAESERPALTGDMLRLLKSQDKAYITTKRVSEDKVRAVRARARVLVCAPP